MPANRIHISFTDRQVRLLEKLMEKLHLDRSSVLKLALARLAEAEKLKD